MAQQPFGLPHILGRMLERMSGPATIARRIVVGRYVVDAQIEFATPAAAEWYGTDDPSHLIGRWISTLHYPDDMRLARLLVTARHFYGAEAAPRRYVSRIAQLHTGKWMPVLKDTEQFMYEGETYWLTHIAQANESPLAAQTSRWADLRPLERMAPQFMGQMTVAEMEEKLLHAEHSLLSQPLADNTNVSIVDYNVSKSRWKFAMPIAARLAMLDETLAQLSKKGETHIWVRPALGNAVRMPLNELIERYEKALAKDQLFCVRCLHTWSPMLEIRTPKKCSKCRQEWHKPYTYEPYGARHTNENPDG